MSTKTAEPASSQARGYLGSQLAEIYDFPDGDGSGQVIAVVTLAGRVDRDDIDAQLRTAGLPPPVIEVVDVGDISASSSSDDFSVAMIVQIAATVVPAASFVVFRAPNTDTGFVDAVTAVVQSERRPSICVVTYGAEEPNFDNNSIRAMERQFERAAQHNITVIASAGDNVGDVMYPTTSPWVLGCGATSLQVSTTAAERSETPWPASGSIGAPVPASSRFPRPVWQRARGMPPGRRLVPDVSAVGDPQTGYVATVNGMSTVTGGTTGSAALWAGLVARLNQQLGRNVGHLNPVLYQLSGTGALEPVADDSTDADWHPTTGLGVPNGRRLLQYLGSAIRSQMVAYAADDLQAADDLEFSEDVNVLAGLVAARSVRPPVSVGLFGDWGSGKSFFMKALRERVDVLATESRRARTASEPRQTLFCANVVQIEFNAWHYMDANLWASLAARIFEGLAEHGAADTSYVDALNQLRTSQLLLDDAKDRKLVAEQSRAAAQQRLATRESELKTVGNAIADSPTVKQAASQLSKVVGTEVAQTSLEDLAAMTADLRSGLHDVRTGWRAVDASESRWSRRRLLAVLAALAVVAVSGLTWAILSQGSLRGWLTVAGSVLASVIVVLTAVLPVARDASRAAAKILGHAERRRQEELARLSRDVDDRTVDVERAQAEVAHAMAPGRRRVSQFIDERYRSDDYRAQTGLLALIQRDLRGLSDRLIEAARVEEDSVPIERVVLYIDDLDRCPPSLVVQVLQAVHLLLAFPLFVVVVGVDSRWLVRALQHEYAVMLDTPRSHSEGADENAYWSATPQNYLEKIFQIPFWIRGMRNDTFARLIQTLTAEPTREDGETVLASATEADVARHIDQPDVEGPDAPTDSARPASEDSTVGGVDLVPPQLIITDREEQFLAELAAFISTPRMAKRLINLYRLLRAYVHDVDQFTGTEDAPGRYREVALLLAIVVGLPHQAGAVLDAIERAPAGELGALLVELAAAGTFTPDDPQVTALQPALVAIAARLDGVEIESAREWIPLIRRFSMIRGHDRLLPSAYPSARQASGPAI